MDILYGPWRDQYFSNCNNTYECVFCDIANNPNNDDINKVVYRNDNAFIVMNKYPYTPGHLLIIPNQHVDSPDELDSDTWLIISSLTRDSVKIMYEYGASGINIGMNVKVEAGAGIPKHIHMHVLPRWKGDTNFITTIGQTRSYGSNFDEVYHKIKSIALKHIKS